MHGSMRYMENHFDMRIDPTKLVPGAKSVITLLLNYFPEKEQSGTSPKISKYAFGNDYHEVIRSKLKLFLQNMKEQIGEIYGRGFVDSAPVLERAWAQKQALAGLVKTETSLLSKAVHFFIATLVVDLELKYDNGFAKIIAAPAPNVLMSALQKQYYPTR